MRILLVSHQFPPFNTIGALAVGKLTAGLVARGHDVVVVSCGNQRPPRTMGMQTGASSVLWVDDPLLPAAVSGGAPVASRGWGVLARIPRPMRRLTRGLRPWFSIPDTAGVWSVAATRPAARAGAAGQADVVVASGPPHSGLLVGARVARRLGVPLVLNLRDLWTDNPYLDLWADDPYLRTPGLKGAVQRRLERTVLGRAAAVFTSTPQAAEILHRRHPSARVLTLMGGIDEFASARDDHRDGGPLRVVHTGILIEGARDPSPLFAAMRLLDDAGTPVEAHFYGLYSESVLPMAKELVVEHLVHVHGLVSHAEARGAQRDADLLLILQWDDPRERAICPGKLFEYLGARRPILTIGPRGGIVDEIITSTGSGAVSLDPAEIRDLLAGMAVEKEDAGAIADLPLETVRDYDRQAQIDGFAEVLEDVTGD